MRQKKEKWLLQTMLLRAFGPSLILMLVFLAFFCVLLNLTVRHNEDVRALHQRERLEQKMTNVEEEITKTYFDQIEVLNSDSCKIFVYMYNEMDWYSRYQAQTELQQKLYTMRIGHDFVKDVILYISSLEKTITGSRVNAPKPEWLKENLLDASEMIVKSDSLPGQVILRVKMADEQAVLLVLLDESLLIRAFEQIGASESAQAQLYWNGETAMEGVGEQLVSAKNIPLSVLLAEGKSSDDQFIQTVLLLCAAFVVVGVLLVLMGILIWNRQIYQPLHKLLIDAFQHMESGDLKYRIAIEPSSPLFPIYGSYNHMMDQMESYVDKDLKQQVLVNRANLKQLQSQISPHFMYNSYYVLYRLIKKGDRESSMQMAENLGQFYQYITRNADDEKHLGEEVDHARNYAVIQKFRFRDMLDVQIESPESSIAGVYVPRLILQPILENAFKYAYETADGGGVMRLFLHYETVSADDFNILVENSGNVSDETITQIKEKLAATEAGIETTALVNIHRRLQIYFGPNSGLDVARSSLGGLQIRIHILREREGQ